jgi:2-desacetyl-2-hydroxyethyl bacteriochlorophyllide A dehydrogenase
MDTNYPGTAKAVRWHDILDVRLDTVAVPELGDTQVLVKWLYGGICGTDKSSRHRGLMVSKDNAANYPAILGHEGSGVVAALGKGVRCDAIGQPLRVGDMVSYHDIKSCGECLFCRQGNGNVCKQYVPSAMKPGSFVEYYTYPVPQIIRIDGLPAREAAMTEPVATTLHANRKADVRIGDTVLVLGGGVIAQLRIQILRQQGAAKIIVAEVQEMKRNLAKKLGADIVLDPSRDNVEEAVAGATNGYGADVVFEDVGLPSLQLLALDAVRPHGTVMMMGISASPVTLNFVDRIQMKELTVKGTIAVAGEQDRRHDYSVAAELIRSKKVLVDPIITHEFAIDDYEKAFITADDAAQAIKVVFKIT